MTQEIMPSQRIEYIDALRGFTMILVVFYHVALTCWHIIGKDIPSIHPFLVQVRMPLFFFISGFVLYKADTKWNIIHIRHFLHKKFIVQIIPTIVFLILYAEFLGFSIYKGICSPFKNGYWFTYTLFEYFVFYSLLRLFFRKQFEDVAIILSAFFFYIINYPHFNLIPISNTCKDILGITQWSYFTFFLLGTLVKKHFNYIERCLDGKWLLLCSILFYFLINFYDGYIPDTGFIRIPINLLRTIAGITIIFAFFREKQTFFSKKYILGKSLQYVGRRTLDIYLLHLFFLPRNLGDAYPVFLEHPMPVIEATASLLVAMIVVAFCLFFSSIIRLSPFLGHYLFGVKSPSK